MLDKKDLKSIKELVKEIVVESEERINARVDVKIEMVEENLENKIDTAVQELTATIKQEVGDLVETDNLILGHLANHEQRITKIETKLKTA